MPRGGSEAGGTEAGRPGAARFRRPTVSGVVTAGVTVVLVMVASVILVIPAVFSVMPISPEAQAVTLCLPGIGPLQRFRDDLRGEMVELVFIHEGVHAEQCRTLGAAGYARRVSTPHGRLAMEAGALCAEAKVLWMRGVDRARVVDRTVETLAIGYFRDGGVTREEIAAAVDDACGEGMGQ